jgi:hypothetical protein
MARIRTIKPEFWTHPILSRLDPHVRLLALAILNHADDHGYFMASPPIVQAACCPFTEDSLRVHGWLTELSRAGWISVKNHPTHGPIGYVVNFAKHQKVNRPSPSKIKSYYFTEDSVSPHGALTEPSLPEQGAGNREQGAGEQGGAQPPPPPTADFMAEVQEANQVTAEVDHRRTWRDWQIQIGHRIFVGRDEADAWAALYAAEGWDEMTRGYRYLEKKHAKPSKIYLSMFQELR